MKYYPIQLDIRGRQCLVVGGGLVGTRKVKGLLRSGAIVTLVSKKTSTPLEELAAEKKIILHKREYRCEDLDNMFMVIGATDDMALNEMIFKDAGKQKILCNIADQPERCNFILPSIVSRGDLTISISTSGKSPAFAKRLRKELEGQFGKEYESFLDLMGAIRKKLLSEAHEPEAHKPLFEELISKGLIDLIKEESIKEIDNILKDVLGKGFIYADLMNTK